MARQLLNELGLVDKNGDGVREFEDGAPVEIEAITAIEKEERISALTVIATDLKEVGIALKVKPIPFNAAMEAVDNHYKWELFLGGFASDVPFHPSGYQNVFSSTGRNHYWNPRQKALATPWEAAIDNNMMCAASSPSFEEQHNCYAEVQRIMARELPLIPLYSLSIYIAANPRLGNVAAWSLSSRGQYNPEELYWEE